MVSIITNHTPGDDDAVGWTDAEKIVGNGAAR